MMLLLQFSFWGWGFPSVEPDTHVTNHLVGSSVSLFAKKVSPMSWERHKRDTKVVAERAFVGRNHEDPG